MRILLTYLLVCACTNLQAQTNVIITIAGNDTAGFAGDGGPATNGKFDRPNQLYFDNFNNLYISEPYNHRIRKIDLTTTIITTVVGTGSTGFNGDNIVATTAHLTVPQGVCTDSAGNIYIADAVNHRIRKVMVSTGIITTIAGSGSTGNSGNYGPATNATMGWPIGLSIDNSNNIFFADGYYHTVRKIDSFGVIYPVAGNGIVGYSGDGNPATAAQFNTPNKTVVDRFGNIIITDSRNNAIRKVNNSTGIISTISGNGTAGYSGDGDPAISAQLNGPAGGFVDKENNYYFADWGNGVIRKIDGTTGIITTVVGCGIQGFSGDGGPATNAKLLPSDIVIDEHGVMYITDYGNNRIRKVYNPQLSVNIPSVDNHVSVYPNPANDEVIIEYSFSNNDNAIIQIADIAGIVLVTKTLLANKQKEEINIHAFSKGLYLYRVFQENTPIAAGKIIKQ